MNVELGVNKHAVIPLWAEVALARYVFWLVIVLQNCPETGHKGLSFANKTQTSYSV